jgi:hypothetical protein
MYSRIVPAHQNQPANWRGKVELLQKARKHLRENEGVMSPYEQKLFGDDLKQQKETWYSDVFNGAAAEYWGVFQAYQQAEQRHKDARRAESKRWDARKLADEMDVAERLVSHLASGVTGTLTGRTGEGMRQILQDAETSGDLYRQRGTLEILKAASAGLSASGRYGGQERTELNHLAKQSERALNDLRVTDEMRQAGEAADVAWGEFQKVRGEFITVGEQMDGLNPTHPLSTSPYTKVLKRVKVDRAGRVELLAEDDPEVVGFEILQSKDTVVSSG